MLLVLQKFLLRLFLKVFSVMFKFCSIYCSCDMQIDHQLSTGASYEQYHPWQAASISRCLPFAVLVVASEDGAWQITHLLGSTFALLSPSCTGSAIVYSLFIVVNMGRPVYKIRIQLHKTITHVVSARPTASGTWYSQPFLNCKCLYCQYRPGHMGGQGVALLPHQVLCPPT